MRRVPYVFAAVFAAMTAFTAAAAAAPLRVLYVDQSVGFVHEPVKRTGGALASSETAMMAIGKESGAFEAEVTQDAGIITPDKLKTIDVLVFYTTGALPIPAPAWQAVQEWVASGKGGFVGLHSATDTSWPYAGPGEDYTRFINGKFAAHPWTRGTPIKLAAHGVHPTTAMWPAAFDYAEEIYQYSDYDPARVRALQSLDFVGAGLKRPWLVPVTWVRNVGKGRLFYTNLGHTQSTWDDPRFRRQIVEGIKWAAGQTEGSATPNPRDQALWAVRSLLAYRDMPLAEIGAVTAALNRADDAWLTDVAARIAALRPIFPEKDADRPAFDAAYSAVVDSVRAKAGR